MPVSSETSISGPFTPNGVTTSFAFDFKAASASEVVATDGDGNVISTALYSVTLDDDEGGTLTFGTAPEVSDYPEIYVLSEPELTQPSDFDNAGPSFNPAALTRAIDRAAIRDLKLNRDIGRALKLPFGEAAVTFPGVAERANKFLSFLPNGDVLMSSGTGADAGLRPDLASSTGGAMVGLVDGGQLSDGLKTITPQMKGAVADGATDDTAAVLAWAAAIGSAVPGLAPGTYAVTAPAVFTGEYTNGLFIDGSGSRFIQTAADQDGLVVDNQTGDIAGEFFNKARLSNYYLYGASKVDGASGAKVEMAADVVLTNFRLRNFQYGLHLVGGLSSAFYNLVSRDNAVGLKAEASAGPPLAAAPNANSFFRPHIMKNDVAIEYDTSANTAISFFGGNIEGNNPGGTTTDGKTVSTFANAGTIGFFGMHDESNLGQTGLKYTGSAAAKNLLIAGSEMISGVGRLVHIETGRFTSIANRINNGSATDDTWFNAANASGVLINHEGRISGTLSKVAALRDGRLGFGRNPLSTEALISASAEAVAAAGNIVADWQNDTIQIRWKNSAGTRVAYIQTSAAGDHTVNNDNAAGGWSLRANNSPRLDVGRGGSMAVEPGGDNTISSGSAFRRWSYTHTYYVKHTPVAVGSLPAAATAGAGARGFVTDSSVAASGNFGATVAGGGSNVVPVFSNGTNWLIG